MPILADAALQRMIGGVRTAAHQTLWTKTSDRSSRRVELSEWRELRIGAAVAVWRIDAGQVNSGRGDIRSAEFEIFEIVVEPSRVTLDVTVAEILRQACHVQQLDLVPRSQSLQVILITLQIDLCIRCNMSGIPVGKQELARRGIRRRKIYWYD